MLFLPTSSASEVVALARWVAAVWVSVVTEAVVTSATVATVVAGNLAEAVLGASVEAAILATALAVQVAWELAGTKRRVAPRNCGMSTRYA